MFHPAQQGTLSMLLIDMLPFLQSIALIIFFRYAGAVMALVRLLPARFMYASRSIRHHQRCIPARRVAARTQEINSTKLHDMSTRAFGALTDDTVQVPGAPSGPLNAYTFVAKDIFDVGALYFCQALATTLHSCCMPRVAAGGRSLHWLRQSHVERHPSSSSSACSCRPGRCLGTPHHLCSWSGHHAITLWLGSLQQCCCAVMACLWW
jgi:hypothetical protein